ncbi:MAG: multicopper oxidase domain-containing protein [Pseudomonadales bacterium]|nr:multicopper oxidase domain-containing protein [Pseudomonadales bacterium]
MNIKRREFLSNVTLGSASLLLPNIVFSQSANQPNELKLPELLTGNQQQGKRAYQLSVQSGISQFLPGLNTATLGINSAYLGPTMKLRKDDDVLLRVRNALEESTTLHWHGLHVPALSDGGPHQVIEPGAGWAPEFKVMQDAGTFWYHSHIVDRTGEQVYRGLAGMIIIEDENSNDLGLPAEYGVDDIPLIVQDRRFNNDGSLRYVQMHRDVMTGFYGDTVLVNGTHNPIFTPSSNKVRFRILNAANARTFNFAFDDNRQFDLVSSDGGLLNAPISSDRLLLAPAERADIVVDVSDGRPFRLLSLPVPANSPFAPRGMMRNMHPLNTENMDILAIQPQSNLRTSEALSPQLAAINSMEESAATQERRFVLSMVMGMGMGMRGGPGGRGNRGGGPGRGMRNQGNFFINNEAMDMAKINHRIKNGSTEIWRIENDSMMMHPFHVHHGQFQILDRNRVPASAIESGYKDTVKVGPGETVRFIMRFENFSDSENAYMYHCHILEHEDNGMMGQFTVE